MMGEKDLDLTAELMKILGENNSAVDSLFKQAAKEKEI